MSLFYRSILPWHFHTIYAGDLYTDAVSRTQFNLNCTHLTISEIKTINLARSISGFTCVLITLVIICLLVWYKSYKSTLRRLFLVFTIDTLAIEILLGLNIEHYFEYKGQEQVCSALGFLIQWTGSMTYWCSLGIVLVLAITVIQTLRGKSTKWKISTEFLLALSIIILPLLHTWPPFLSQNYGLEFAYCWIKEKDNNCSSVGESDRLQYFIISQVIELICVLVTVILAVLYCLLRCKYRHIGTAQVMTLLCQTLLLMAFLVCHWLWNVVAQVIYKLPIKEYSQWLYTDAIPVPFTYLIVPFGFLVHLYAVRHSGCCVSISKCCQKNQPKHHLYTVENNQTSPTSHPVEVRSDTYWSVPYTNEFTNVVSNTEQDYLLKINTSDTGYGSHENS